MKQRRKQESTASSSSALLWDHPHQQLQTVKLAQELGLYVEGSLKDKKPSMSMDSQSL